MNQVRFIEVAPDHAGQRLDNFLLRELKGVPKTRIYRALRKGEIRVNKGRVRGDYRVNGGDKVRIPPLRVAEREADARVPQRWQDLLDTRVLYEDSGLLVIDKPSGLAVHGGSGLRMGLIECIRNQDEESQPALVVCPASLVENWLREAGRFTPLLKLLKHHGPKRAKEPVTLEIGDENLPEHFERPSSTASEGS